MLRPTEFNLTDTIALLLRTLQHTRRTVAEFEADLDRLVLLLDHLRSLLNPE